MSQPDTPPSDEQIAFWRELAHDPEHGMTLLKLKPPRRGRVPSPSEILARPELATTRELWVIGWQPDEEFAHDFRPWFDALARTPTALRVLRLDSLGSSSWVLHDYAGDLAALFAGQPQLEELDLTGTPSTSAPLDAPVLRSFRVQGRVTDADLFPRLLRSAMPRIESLTLHGDAVAVTGQSLAIEHVEAFFARTDLPALRVLKLPTLSADPELFSRVARSPLLPQLEQLSLVHAPQPDEAPFARDLAQHLDAFAHLKRFTVGHTLMSQELRARHPGLRQGYG